MGTHPDEPKSAPPFPPHKGGGNIDTRHLKVGSSVLLPVFVRGALFSCGDPHAAQGDGEVCVAALECSMQASLRFTVHKRSIVTPRFVVAGPLTPRVDPGGFYGTMGIDTDLMQGARKAVLGMIELLGEEHGVSREDAYVLCSLVGDLKILRDRRRGGLERRLCAATIGFCQRRLALTTDHEPASPLLTGRRLRFTLTGYGAGPDHALARRTCAGAV